MSFCFIRKRLVIDLRVLGIDYGDSRVGLSLSDELLITAQPYKMIKVNDRMEKLGS